MASRRASSPSIGWKPIRTTWPRWPCYDFSDVDQRDVGDGKVEGCVRHARELLDVAKAVGLALGLVRVGVFDGGGLQIDAQGLRAASRQHAAEAPLAAPQVNHAQASHIARELQHPVIQDALPSLIPPLPHTRNPRSGELRPLRLKCTLVGHGSSIHAVVAILADQFKPRAGCPRPVQAGRLRSQSNRRRLLRTSPDSLA